ncbi:hypothetical protein AGMMS50249_7010 [candidate division SR1 bacterium]|nr:hypothetical protein AGMMS50249_7010 [candidate division SR1 bacterium]
MKKSSFLLVLASCMILTGCGEQSVIEYNDLLVASTKSCLTAEVALWEAMAASDAPSTHSSLATAKISCQKSFDEITDIGAFQRDNTLQQAVLTVINTENEYLSILESTLSFSTDENRTDQQEIAYLALQGQLTAIRERAIDQSESVMEIQKTFAQTHNFIIEGESSL